MAFANIIPLQNQTIKWGGNDQKSLYTNRELCGPPEGSDINRVESLAPRAKRRSFTASYKLWVLEEADKCYKPGQIGALLRREGLYSSHLTSWRRQRKAGELAGLTSKKRGRKRDEQAAEMTRLQQRKRRFASPVTASGVDDRCPKKTLTSPEHGDGGRSRERTRD